MNFVRRKEKGCSSSRKRVHFDFARCEYSTFTWLELDTIIHERADRITTRGIAKVNYGTYPTLLLSVRLTTISDYGLRRDLGYDRAWELSGDSMGYDVERYTELLLRAVETVLAPFGVNAKMLRDHLTRALPMPLMEKQIAAKGKVYWGPSFEWRNKIGVQNV